MDERERELEEADLALLQVLATNLRRCRAERGLTLEKLAWAVGVDKGYLSRVENGLRAPSLPVLRRLAGELAVEVWELLRSRVEIGGEGAQP